MINILKSNYLYCTVAIILLLMCVWSCTKKDNKSLSFDKIVASGYRYLVYGSQNSNGIELYDLKQQKFIQFLMPAKQDTIYKDPVIGKSGNGYCIKIDNIFDQGHETIDIISIDLNSLKYEQKLNLKAKKYAAIALSPNEERLALVYADSLDSQYVIGIFDVLKEKVVNEFPVNIETPINITWKPDNKSIVLWSTLVGGAPAEELNIETEESQKIDIYPLDYSSKNMLAMGGEKERIYLRLLESKEKQVVVKKNATGHSYTLSENGKYIVWGSLEGMGFEKLTIMDVLSKRKQQIKLKDHAGTVSGLAFW